MEDRVRERESVSMPKYLRAFVLGLIGTDHGLHCLKVTVKMRRPLPVEASPHRTKSRNWVTLVEARLEKPHVSYCTIVRVDLIDIPLREIDSLGYALFCKGEGVQKCCLAANFIWQHFWQASALGLPCRSGESISTAPLASLFSPLHLIQH